MDEIKRKLIKFKIVSKNNISNAIKDYFENEERAIYHEIHNAEGTYEKDNAIRIYRLEKSKLELEFKLFRVKYENLKSEEENKKWEVKKKLDETRSEFIHLIAQQKNEMKAYRESKDYSLKNERKIHDNNTHKLSKLFIKQDRILEEVYQNHTQSLSNTSSETLAYLIMFDPNYDFDCDIMTITSDKESNFKRLKNDILYVFDFLSTELINQSNKFSPENVFTKDSILLLDSFLQENGDQDLEEIFIEYYNKEYLD